MYEKPELTRVGNADQTILGALIDGDDLDMNWIIQNGGQFEAESLSNEK